ncbi:MAG: insulinase family protein [Psychroserpens sp.]|uniref:M16 family metallopeptidase n=1 Tax=Psychroserpens sp. TaxID=2020870 RepID=UPI0030027404
MKNILLLVCLLAICVKANAQTLELNTPLPQDNSIRKGVLKNGITYYIYKTDVIKDAASYYIIQNVGSILENEDQQGLAHFLEHMAFNGTKNFPGKSILNTLEKHGAIFGKNINAYTSFDETVYNLDNIPTNVDGLIDTCLLVLHDWSNYLSLSNDEIDSERGVVKEEWRTRQNGGMRIFMESNSTKYNNAKYATRMPIGQMDVVDNFKYKALKDFYHDWYRTDLQAIAIVGDVDVDEIEQKIIAKFTDIPAIEKINRRERFTVEVPNNKTPLFKLSMDKEVPYSKIDFTIKHPNSLEDEKVADLRKSLLTGITTSIVNSRIHELTQDSNSPFNNGGIRYSKLARLTNVFRVVVSPKPNKQSEAFKIVLQEIIRAKKFGFSKGEINRAITQYTSSYENLIKRLEEIRHGEIIKVVKANYLENKHMTDPVKEFELAKIIFAEIDSRLLQEILNDLYTVENRTILVTGVEGEENLTRDATLEIINKAENDPNLSPYVDSFDGKSLMSNITILPGIIVSEETNKVLESSTFTLSNGVKVHYKYANKNKNMVALNAISYGGTSILSDKDLPSAGYATSLASRSGISEFTSTDLRKINTGKTANVSMRINGLSEVIKGSSVTKDIETMLQMVYLKFTHPRFDKKMYDKLFIDLQNNLEKRSKNINAIMQDKFITEVYGDQNPKRRLMTQSFLNDLSFDKMKDIYKDRFNDISDFEFFIVGDVKVNVLRPLLEKYIASIPDIVRNETWKDNTVNWIADKIDQDIHVKMETPKSTVIVKFVNEMPYSLKNTILAKALADILKLRYTSSLREEEGGTYGASVNASINEKPVNKGVLSVTFDCDAKKVENLIPIVYKEIEKIKKGEIPQEDIDKTITNYLKNRKESKEFNSYDMSLLINYFLKGYNMNSPENYEDIVNSITPKDIQKFASELTNNSASFEIVFKPEQ